MKKYIVYRIINTKNNRVYIGSTQRTLKKRRLEHLRLLNSGKHYNKYMQIDYDMFSEYFEFSELCECKNLDDMLEKENYYINVFGGIESHYTYNYQDNNTKNLEYSLKISKSAIGRIPWNKNRKMTPDEILVNSRSHIGIKRSNESIIKQKESIKNNPNFGNRGKKLSQITRQKISLAKKGKVALNKGVKNKKHKYDDLVPILREEYSKFGSYTKVHQLHPDICYDSIRSLILFGDTNKSFKKCND